MVMKKKICEVQTEQNSRVISTRLNYSPKVIYLKLLVSFVKYFQSNNDFIVNLCFGIGIANHKSRHRLDVLFLIFVCNVSYYAYESSQITDRLLMCFHIHNRTKYEQRNKNPYRQIQRTKKP